MCPKEFPVAAMLRVRSRGETRSPRPGRCGLATGVAGALRIIRNAPSLAPHGFPGNVAALRQNPGSGGAAGRSGADRGRGEGLRCVVNDCYAGTQRNWRYRPSRLVHPHGRSAAGNQVKRSFNFEADRELLGLCRLNIAVQTRPTVHRLPAAQPSTIWNGCLWDRLLL